MSNKRPKHELTIDDFDLGEYAHVPIKRIYDNYWIILAQSEQDYKNKVNKIIRGDIVLASFIYFFLPKVLPWLFVFLF